MKKDHSREPASAAAVLRSLLSRSGLAPALSRYRILLNWPGIVESTVARHTKAEGISGSTLLVAVDSSVWMHELAAIKDVILQKVNAALDPGAAGFTDIRFFQRSWAQAQSQRPASVEPVPDPATAGEPPAESFRELLEPVKDADLKKLLQKILEKDQELKRRRGRAD